MGHDRATHALGRASTAKRPMPFTSHAESTGSHLIQRAPDGCACGGSCPRCTGASNLNVGPPDDASEREANLFADRLMHMTPGRVSLGAAPAAVQRKCDACEHEEEGEQHLHRQMGPSSSVGHRDAGSISSRVDSALRSPGQPLEPATRQFFEPRFGFDFASVRVHCGDDAAIAAAALNARAFTVGSDIAFAPGEFRPETASGQRLLAHELTHVVQQASEPAIVRRQHAITTPDWEKQLDDILPRRLGLVASIDRMAQLMDRFDTAQLGELVRKIHADTDATKLTRDEAGVPGIIALYDTRAFQLTGSVAGYRLDVPAARFLLNTFPARRPTPRKSEDEKAEVYSEDVVRSAYIRFHYNALLPKKEDLPADMPGPVRENCIAIVHDMLPKLFSSEAVVKQVRKRLAELRARGETYTMVHTGDAMTNAGVAGRRVEIRFKDATGRATNGNTEPKTLSESAWEKVKAAVGSDYGWHIFGVALMDGYHSVTLFIDNQPGGLTLYWADQWAIDPGDDFKQVPGAISGFRQYEKSGFDAFIEWYTNSRWNQVHSADSKCGKAHPKNWDSACRYNATLMLWHLRKSTRP